MTKTFTEKGIEYILVEVLEDGTSYEYLASVIPDGQYSIISLLKDITEEQAKEIACDSYGDDDFHNFYYRHYIEYLLRQQGIDTSLNWLLLKKI